MSKEVGPGAIAAIVVIAVLILGVWGWRTFRGAKAPSDAQQLRLMQEEEAVRFRSRGIAPGGYPQGR